MSDAQKRSSFDPEKWAKAVVNLETRQGYSNTPQYHELVKKWQRQEISHRDFIEITRELSYRNPRATGSAVYLKYKDRHYLITARHVLEDRTPQFTPPGLPVEKQIQVYEKIIIIENGATVQDSNVQVLNRVISHYTAGGHEPYIFAPGDLDLAVLNLDNRDVGWDKVETLRKMGYVPLDISDIDIKCKELHENKKIYSVGYTGGISQIGEKNITRDQLIW